MQAHCRERRLWAPCGMGKEDGQLSFWVEVGAEISECLQSGTASHSPRQSHPSQWSAQLCPSQVMVSDTIRIFRSLLSLSISARTENVKNISSAAGRWELDAATVEFLEPTAKKAAAAEGLVPVYSQR